MLGLWSWLRAWGAGAWQGVKVGTGSTLGSCPELASCPGQRTPRTLVHCEGRVALFHYEGGADWRARFSLSHLMFNMRYRWFQFPSAGSLQAPPHAVQTHFSLAQSPFAGGLQNPAWVLERHLCCHPITPSGWDQLSDSAIPSGYREFRDGKMLLAEYSWVFHNINIDKMIILHRHNM